MPKVTVLMPVHNGEMYVAEAITSILNQTFHDFEFLIINDGSTDDTVKIIESFKDDRIRLIHNERNLQLIATLNKGIELAQGEYIARMDCDDFSLPERLSRQVSLMDDQRQIGICGTWILVKGAQEFINRYPVKHASIRCGLLFETMFAHPTVMIRKNEFVINGLAYDANDRHAEDYALWVRCADHLKLANIPEVLLQYRIHPQQISSQKQDEQRATARRIRGDQLKRLDLVPNEEDLDLHEAICLEKPCRTEESLAATEDWLLRLSAANKHKSYYSEPEFSKTLAEMWFKICRNSRNAGLKGKLAFQCSPLSRAVKPRCLGWSRLKYAEKYQWLWP